MDTAVKPRYDKEGSVVEYDVILWQACPGLDPGTAESKLFEQVDTAIPGLDPGSQDDIIKGFFVSRSTDFGTSSLIDGYHSDGTRIEVLIRSHSN